MSKRTVCHVFSFYFLAAIHMASAPAQAPAQPETPSRGSPAVVQLALPDPKPESNLVVERPPVTVIPISRDDQIVSHDWQVARQAGSTKGRIDVVTLDRPERRQSCRIRSFTADKLVCAGGLGRERTYLSQQVVALIVPGEGPHDRLKILLGLNGAMGAAIWGTVVLTATCPACAAATAVAALLIFSACGAIAYSDYAPDLLLYLAPGQHLSDKLRFVGR